MKRTAPLLLVALVAVAGLLAACPSKDPAPPGPPVGPQPPRDGVAAPASPTPADKPKAPASWSEQAERVAKALEDLAAAAEKGDKEGALKLQDHAYFRCYEDPDWHLEAASMANLPEEDLDGKPRNVKICREDLFAQIKSAVKVGAPASKVRELCDELSRKVRADAKKLDELKISPQTPR